jgi:hypothetical protein
VNADPQQSSERDVDDIAGALPLGTNDLEASNECGLEPVTAVSIDRACTAHVSVVLAAVDQSRQHELVERWGEIVQEPLEALGFLHEMSRQDEPAKTERRSKRLRNRAELDDSFWVETLEGAHRLAVVAELGVVVVLGDQGTPFACPTEQLAAPHAAQHGAGRELVGGSDEHRVGVEAANADALLVDRLSDELEAEGADAFMLAAVRGILDRDP